MKWCHTDLGAMALRRRRLLEEGVRFGAQAGGAAGPGHEHADGLLAARIVEAGAPRLSKECCWVILGVHVCADLSAECRHSPCQSSLHMPSRSAEQGAST